MKLLNLSLMVNENLNIGLSKAFRDNPKISQYHEIPVNENCFERLANIDFEPDVIFCQIQNDKIGKRNTLDLNPTLQKFRNLYDSFIISWNGDIRQNTPIWMSSFDSSITCFTNHRDVDYARDNWGHRSDFLQIGIDPEVFNKNHNLKIEVPEIVFFGNHSGQFPLSGFRKQAVTQLKKRYGNRFQVYGNGYREAKTSFNADPRNPNENQIKESYIYSRAKVGISISHFNSEGYFSDRLLRGMGSGCCMLSHSFPGYEEMFSNNQISVFKDIPDLLRVCDMLLDDYRHRNEVAKRGHDYVHANHTYHNMVEDILNLYDKWK